MSQAKEYRIFETEVWLPYRVAYGETWTRFFEGMKEQKLYGTQCRKCGRVLVPARSFCPRCFVDTSDWVEVSQTGNLQAFCYTNYRYYGQALDPPYVTALIRLDRTEVDFVHLIGGIDLTSVEAVSSRLAKGMRLHAVWEKVRQGHILDIKHFEPVE
ncbi:MAG: Zn-ribbon domain-containing OB-fold protein [Desulfomonilaceae bacterium]|nr:Zn-ribbon domain-containing OB-fold protein [Desulfomonilaceae bacterium]